MSRIIFDKDILTKPCEKVSISEGVQIASELFSILEETHNGVALAAPQVGIHKKVCVIKTNGDPVYLINPKIVERANPFINVNEGCLSFPGVYLNTVRYNNIVVESEDGVKKFNNFSSVAAQHEIDHLNQILFFERQVPQKYDLCFCDSGVKFKFCCRQKLYES